MKIEVKRKNKKKEREKRSKGFIDEVKRAKKKNEA